MKRLQRHLRSRLGQRLRAHRTHRLPRNDFGGVVFVQSGVDHSVDVGVGETVHVVAEEAVAFGVGGGVGGGGLGR